MNYLLLILIIVAACMTVALILDMAYTVPVGTPALPAAGMIYATLATRWCGFWGATMNADFALWVLAGVAVGLAAGFGGAWLAYALLSRRRRREVPR